MHARKASSSGPARGISFAAKATKMGAPPPAVSLSPSTTRPEGSSNLEWKWRGPSFTCTLALTSPETTCTVTAASSLICCSPARHERYQPLLAAHQSCPLLEAQACAIELGVGFMDYRGSVVAPEPVESAAVNGSTGDDGGAAPGGEASFDANMVIILAALFFALLFAIGLNSLARCALRFGGPRGGASSSGGCGVRKRALKSIPVEVYKEEAEEEEVCAICLGEFADGEKVRVLPRCRHGFHVRCVDAWLLSRGSCPTCRQAVMAGSPAKGGGVGEGRRPPDSDTVAVVIT